ncbi:MAG TPA: MBOAT family O-acyltransferase [Bacteroidia bacterium]|nr:MBOAT family O-acyltransferase [Bacteroidia bacterium]
MLILIASYIFMAWWDVRFLLVLIVSSIVNFVLGIYIAKTEDNENRQRLFLWIGLIHGLGSLLFFKYCNFFIQSLVGAFDTIDVHLNIHTLNIILPLGISFYTFRAMSYLMDVESGKTKPVSDWIVFFSYLSFFPCSLSGPIDKARDFVPQLEKKRVFDSVKAADGLRQILWGLFKKVVIADNCSGITAQIFEQYHLYPGSTLMLAAFLYTIEIYADFSGYSDMAVGISRLLGFNVINNFRLPFFAQNIAEFWQKWHISLTAWMTEYVFTPLSFIFRTYGKGGTILAIIINFVLVGLWHGANWTFIVYGFLHGCYFIPLILKGKVNSNQTIAENKMFPTFREFMNVVGTFILVMLTLVLFNSHSITQAIDYYAHLFSSSLFSALVLPLGMRNIKVILTLVFILIMFNIEWIGRKQAYAIENIALKWIAPLRWTMYYILIFLIFYFSGNEQQFIYFQF